jgi:hypothetical protein
MWKTLLATCYLILLGIVLAGFDSRQPRADQNISKPGINDQDDATFEISVSLWVRPSSPTTYDRTAVGVTTPLPLELVDMVDETRNIQARSLGRVTRLDQLFGPKSGLTDHMTIRAVVRVRGVPGEKIVRKTVWFHTVTPEIMQKAETKGSISVVVELDVPNKPEAGLSPEAILVQRRSISQAQDDLLAALEGTEYKLIRRFDVIPGCALDASPRALTVLDRLPNVVKVSEDYSYIIRIP